MTNRSRPGGRSTRILSFFLFLFFFVEFRVLLFHPMLILDGVDHNVFSGVGHPLHFESGADESQLLAV